MQLGVVIVVKYVFSLMKVRIYIIFRFFYHTSSKLQRIYGWSRVSLTGASPVFLVKSNLKCIVPHKRYPNTTFQAYIFFSSLKMSLQITEECRVKNTKRAITSLKY